MTKERKIIRNHDAIFWVFIAPILLCLIMYYAIHVTKRLPKEIACAFTCDKDAHKVLEKEIMINDRTDLVSFDFQGKKINVKATEAASFLIIVSLTIYILCTRKI